MSNYFKNIGLALTFSPNAVALLREADRLKNLFKSGLTLIIINESDSAIEEKVDTLIRTSEINKENLKISYGKGEVSKEIIRISEKEKIDLLIAGALEKETEIKYYLGSVARRLMRNSSCSLLILKNPSLIPTLYKSFFVITNYSAESEKAIKIMNEFAKLENSNSLNIIRNYNIPALNSTILGSGSTKEIDKIKYEVQHEEEEKMKFHVKELNLSKVDIKTYCIYGKQGWETWNFIKSQNADILAFHSSKKNSYFLEKFFPNEEEYYYQQLPSNLLIIR
jgi:nucleotide-binding universal stress UspA family protein